MTTYVLVHGAFGSAAELAPVIPELEARGHHAIAVDLPCVDPMATLDDYADTVAAARAAIDGRIVVVGHSAGGATISLVPARTRVDRLIYVTAVVPEPKGADALKELPGIGEWLGAGVQAVGLGSQLFKGDFSNDFSALSSRVARLLESVKAAGS